MITRAAAVILAAVAMMLTGPASVAVGDDNSYFVPAPVSVTPAVVEPGGRSTIEFSSGFFEAGERVATDVSGARSPDARVVGSDGAPTLVSRADGGLTAVFRAPEHGYGIYEVTFSASRDYVAIVTVTSANVTHPDRGFLAHPVPDLGIAAPGAGVVGVNVPGNETTLHPPGLPDEWVGSRDREGRVQIPGTRPDAPEWPDLDYLPWAIVLLAGIAIVATTVTATLSIAARRRS